MNWPKVSVIISTYDRPKMLVRALGSVLAQTFQDFEVIVVDDASNTAVDACAEIADSRVIVLEMPQNSGYQSAPKNVGIHNSRGSYIAYLDDDNEWDPNHLELLVEEIEKSGADLVYSRWRNDGHGRSGEFGFVPPSPAALTGLTHSPSLNFIDTSAILHSKAGLISKLGPLVWNEDIRRFGDWDLVRRCVLNGATFSAIDKVTFTYWWHGENLQLTRPINEAKTKVGHSNTTKNPWSGGESVWRG